ncbi:putative integral membrane protein [Rosellinia necatrix]|uniref:Putative integral membrane protein n=1 Tax=Rosellinia necatrix TaxID=77044 RepID=A0A1W2TS83_ROSNE|nr:putative integral membrane protein [Rosellinia necatrix]
MRLHIAAFAAFASPALAAYVQWQYCDGYKSNIELVPEGLSAHLERRHSGTQATFRLLEGTTRDNCDSISPDLNVAVDIALLGRSTSYLIAPDTSCSASRWAQQKDNRSTILDVAVTTDIDIFYPLSTFHLDFHLSRLDVTDEIECISADITQEFTAMVKAILRLVPAVTFLIVLIIGCLRSFIDVRDATVGGHDGSERLGPRSVLPSVGDCLYHLQFVFFTGALSLRYPGFYQPAVSYLNWFSLLTNSNALTGGITYPGVGDGIYQINGTYGGTYGLEIMTQIVGAPMSMDLWVNMVILIVFISIGIAVLLEISWFLNRHRQPRSREEQQEHTGFRRLASQVLRSVLSYFLLPLVTLSAYQLDRANILPAYHTSLAVGLIVVIILAFLWLLQQLPIRNLGVLILDHSKAYQPISSTGGRDESFVMSFFVLTFIRAIAIGGLQLATVAQITVLIVSEIAFIACIAAFSPDSFVSTSSACAVSRLTTLLLMVAFVPGLAGLSTKSIVGYILLFQHVMVLLFAILLPSIYQFIQLCLVARTTENPPVYSLRQLRRRRTRGSISQHHYPDVVSHNGETESVSNTVPVPSLIHTDRPHDSRIDTLSVSSHYFRPPRSSSRSPSAVSLASRPVADARSSRSSSPTNTTSESGSEPNSPELDSATQSLFSRTSTPILSDATSLIEIPLGPHWDDYSFREVDLAYGRPPEKNSNRERAEQEMWPQKRHVSNRSILSLVLERSTPKQKGFEVDRSRI